MPSPAAICTNPVISDPTGSEQNAPTNMPGIPVATDAASTMAAVNALRQAYYNNQGGGSPRNASPQVKPNPSPNKNKNDKNQNKDRGRFVELSRQTQIVQVFNPDDNTQWVKVEQIVALELQNPITGEIWVWKR